jgi:hypothetical protein
MKPPRRRYMKYRVENWTTRLKRRLEHTMRE